MRVRALRFRRKSYFVISYPFDGVEGGPLTRAERDVVSMLLAGDSLRSIAFARGVSLRTVTNQIQSIYKKLGVHSREELVVATRERPRSRGRVRA